MIGERENTSLTQCLLTCLVSSDEKKKTIKEKAKHVSDVIIWHTDWTTYV